MTAKAAGALDALCWIGGDVGPLAAARVPVCDRGFLFGEGVFETIRIVRGRAFRLDAHLARLEAAAVALGIEPPELRERSVAAAHELVRRWGARDGMLKVIVTGGDPPELEPQLVATIAPPRPLPARARTAGVSVEVAGARQNGTSPLARMKTLAYLDRVLARDAAAAHDRWEAIFLDARGHVAEGCVTNIFWAREGRLFTPALALGILPGIARGAVLEVAAEAGVEVVEGAFPLEDLARADEAFLTNALVGVLPVRDIEERPLRGAPGPLTRGFAAQLEALVEVESREV